MIEKVEMGVTAKHIIIGIEGIVTCKSEALRY